MATGGWEPDAEPDNRVICFVALPQPASRSARSYLLLKDLVAAARACRTVALHALRRAVMKDLTEGEPDADERRILRGYLLEGAYDHLWQP